jgi:hypothetical protein
MPRSFEAENGVARNKDEPRSGRRPDEVGLEPAQADVHETEMPGGRGWRRSGPTDSQGEGPGRVEDAVRFEDALVAVEDEGELPPFPFDEKELRAEARARQAVEPEVPNRPENGPDEPGRRPGSAEIFERALV